MDKLDQFQYGTAPTAPSQPPTTATPDICGPVVSWLPAGEGSGAFRERYTSVCQACHDAREPCTHWPEVPLKLLIVGHNPSDSAWDAGFAYANSSNMFMRLLAGYTGLREATATMDHSLLPPAWMAQVQAAATTQDRNAALGDALLRQHDMPACLGIGITDLMIVPGNDSAALQRNKAAMAAARRDLQHRLTMHVRRAAAVAAGDAYDAVCGQLCGLQAQAIEPGASAASTAAGHKRSRAGAATPILTHTPGWQCAQPPASMPDFPTWPAIAPMATAESQVDDSQRHAAPDGVLFTAKGVFQACFPNTRITLDDQGIMCIPFSRVSPVDAAGWPLRPDTQLWVAYSTSGRAWGTHIQRVSQYTAVAAWANDRAWPRSNVSAPRRAATPTESS